MKYIVAFLLCLSCAEADYSRVESVGDYILIDDTLAIRKTFIYKIAKRGNCVRIFFTKKAQTYDYEDIKDVTVDEVLRQLVKG